MNKSTNVNNYRYGGSAYEKVYEPGYFIKVKKTFLEIRLIMIRMCVEKYCKI